MADSTTRLRALPPPAAPRPASSSVWIDQNMLVDRQRQADMVKAEIDGAIARIKAEHGRWGWEGDLVLPESGLCRGPIVETFDGIRLEYFCTRPAGHREPCTPPEVAEPEDVEAHGCLDAPHADEAAP